MKKLLKILFSRLVFVALFMILQLLSILAALTYFRDNVTAFYSIFIVLSLIVVVYILNSDGNAAFKIAWIIPIIVLPIFGTPLYFMFGKTKLTKTQRKKVYAIQSKHDSSMALISSRNSELAAQSVDAALQSRYLEHAAIAPVYNRTSTEFFPLGDVMYPKMLSELKKAEHFIFLEYFIVQPGKMWDAMLDILLEKVAAGVDVRLIYDDMGSILTLPRNYCARLEARGIKCCVFRRFQPVLSGSFNNRDHRKICVIDGDTAFTGGINLADEYINAFPKHGHWSDCGVMLKGDAVFSFTAMFLSMWDYIRKQDEDFSAFAPRPEKLPEQGDGFVQPFSDSPMDNEAVGETAYINMISHAKRYVYITTPYLVIDSELMNALTTAAKCGVDVRIMTPGIPDKWYVFAVTRSYYSTLIRAGVRIFEYTPGFMHAKTFVADDEYAICGTINLDFRSLFLHYECAAWMFRSKAVPSMVDSFLNNQALCAEITDDYCRSRSWLLRLTQSLLRVFAPMM
ncbi:MAG: cardiolipin synthase [Oscillospiraceae bacterium]